MADGHHLAVVARRRDLERRGDRRGRERVVAADLQLVRQSREEAAAVVVNDAGLPVHELAGWADLPAECLDDRLVSEADAERGDACTANERDDALRPAARPRGHDAPVLPPAFAAGGRVA